MNMYKQAILSQGAVNLGALVRSWAAIIEQQQKEAHEKGNGTAWINRHPVNVLFVEQLYHLTGYGSRYSEASAECHARQDEAERPPQQELPLQAAG